jgi:molybdopterin-guanine dinucleotide biosynthesis protein A
VRPVPAYLLSGGKSSRFGSDKARAEIDGVPLLLRLARRIEPFVSSVVVVADRADRYQDLGLVIIPDLTAGLGPLGGLQAALDHAGGAGWILVASCDLLDLRSDWVEDLGRHATGAAQAVVFRDRYWQAFPGLYHTSLLPEIEQRLRSGDGSMRRLLETVAAVGLALPATWPSVLQANTRADLSAYVAARSSGRPKP